MCPSITNFPGKCDWWCWLDLLPCGCSLYWVVTLICAYECSALTCNSSANANSGTFIITSRGQNAMLLLFFKTCVSAIILVVWIGRYYNQNTQFSSILQYSNYVCIFWLTWSPKSLNIRTLATCFAIKSYGREPGICDHLFIFSSPNSFCLVVNKFSALFSQNTSSFLSFTLVLRLRFSPKSSPIHVNGVIPCTTLYKRAYHLQYRTLRYLLGAIPLLWSPNSYGHIILLAY